MQTHKPTEGKQTRTWQRPRSKHARMDPNTKAWKRGKQSTNMQKRTNPNPLLKLGCMDVGLDH